MKARDLKVYLDKAKRVVNETQLTEFEHIRFNNGTISVQNFYNMYSFKSEVFSGIEGYVELNCLYKTISKLKNTEIEFLSNEEKLILKTAKGDFNFKFSDVEFRELEPITEEIGFIKSSHLPLLKKACNYVIKDCLRPILENIYIENNYVLATDYYKMCFYECEDVFADKDEKLFIDTTTAKILDFEGKIYQSHKYLKIVSANETIIQEKIEGKFPNWKAVVPENNYYVIFDSKELLEKIEFAKISGDKDLIKFHFDKNGVSISSENLDEQTSYSTTLQTKYSDTHDFCIGFNPTLLQDIIKTEKTNEISVALDPSLLNKGIIINENAVLMSKQI